MTKQLRPSKSYRTTEDRLMMTLSRYGAAVLPNIIPEQECIGLRDRIWGDIGRITMGRFQINNPMTWREYYELFPLHSMPFNRTYTTGLGYSTRSTDRTDIFQNMECW